jgi:hypothetical protein
MSPDTYAIAGFISSVLAAHLPTMEHRSFFTDKPLEVRSILTQRPHRILVLAAYLGWARLLVDRYRELVEVPAPSHKNPGGRHHFTSDDESELSQP